jgi:hypothetical protein
MFIQQVEAYLRGDPRFKDSFPVPTELLVNPKRIPQDDDKRIYLRFPSLERLLSIIAARSESEKIGHPFGCQTLGDVEHLVCQNFPVLFNPHLPVTQLIPPDLPYIKAKFLFCERTYYTPC